MTRPSQLSLRAFRPCLAALALALAACSSATPEQVEPEATATAQSTATAAPQPTTEPTTEPAPTSTGTAETAAPTSSIPPPSGRPAMSFEGKDKVQNGIGETPSAKIVLTSDQSTLRIPEYAFFAGEPILVTFMVDKKPPKKAKGGTGQVYRMMAQKPPAEDTTTVTTRGPKFNLRLPAGKAATANLAVGEIKKDDKGKEQITWKVIAPLKTEEGFAIFELTEFGNTLLQITSEAPQ